MWKVTLMPEMWNEAVCSCPMWSKNFTCKHSLGIAIRTKCPGCIVPEEAKAIPLEKKRKRGRPSRSKAALVPQDT